jgi:hypothetical protein
LITIRFSSFDNVLFNTSLVMNHLFATMTSLRTRSVMVVARLRILETVPLEPLIVTIPAARSESTGGAR